jgi:hypothetical protein
VKILLAAASFGLSFGVLGCGIIPGLGTTDGSGSSAGNGGSSSSGTPGGTECGTDPETSAVLCLLNSVCPGLTIDSEVYPGCGFRPGNLVDIECSCSGMLCPLGATSCSDAQAKLADQNYGVVCAQVSAGTCLQGTPVAGSSSASSSSGGSTCDTVCRDECAGEPTCIQGCGC